MHGKQRMGACGESRGDVVFLFLKPDSIVRMPTCTQETEQIQTPQINLEKSYANCVCACVCVGMCVHAGMCVHQRIASSVLLAFHLV